MMRLAPLAGLVALTACADFPITPEVVTVACAVGNVVVTESGTIDDICDAAAIAVAAGLFTETRFGIVIDS